MKSVYIVTYERYDHFQILEVFRSRESALKYLESDTVSGMVRSGYNLDSFYIIEKIVWDD
jgi:hypothetical protein